MKLIDILHIILVAGLFCLLINGQCQQHKVINHLETIEASQKQFLERADKLEVTQKIIADSIGKIETNNFNNVKKIKYHK